MHIEGLRGKDNQQRTIQIFEFEGEESCESDHDDLRPRPRAHSTQWIAARQKISSRLSISMFADKLGVGSTALRVSVEAPLTLTVPYPCARNQETLLPTLPRALLPAKYSTLDLSNQSLLLQIL